MFHALLLLKNKGYIMEKNKYVLVHCRYILLNILDMCA
jgi:hypothetical protein